MRVVVSARAYADLQDIFLFIAGKDPSAAERMVSDINRRYAYLAGFPYLGRPWPDADSPIRRLVAGSYLIFYREETTRLVILRVLDGRMDVEAELLK